MINRKGKDDTIGTSILRPRGIFKGILKKHEQIKKTISYNKGITLVALVITIIILIILAGVTIQIVFGQNGLIKRTYDAKEKTKMESVREKVITILSEYQIEKITGKKTLTEFLRRKSNNKGN